MEASSKKMRRKLINQGNKKGKMFIQCSLKVSFQGQRNPQKQKSKENYFI